MIGFISSLSRLLSILLRIFARQNLQNAERERISNRQKANGYNKLKMAVEARRNSRNSDNPSGVVPNDGHQRRD